MPAKKRGLGRGFASLIPSELLDESFDPTREQDERVSELRNIEIKNIVVDEDQPRKQFDEVSLAELSASIKEHGILQPLVVTPHGSGKFQIVAGERRYRAAKMAGLGKVPALIRTLTDQHKLEISLIENLQRRDLNPIETAMAYLKLRDQFNLTLEAIGERVGGKSISSISNTLRILRLPKKVRELVSKGELTEGQVRSLVGLDVKLIDKILPEIIKNEMSARSVERLVARLKLEAKGDNKFDLTSDEISRFENTSKKLSAKLGVKVQVSNGTKGSGRLVIRFKDINEFKSITDKLL